MGWEELSDDEAARRAVAVLRALAAQGHAYQGIDWAVSVHEEQGRKRVYATSNESMGYLPHGARWPGAAAPAFDPTDPDMLPWRGLENPARIMVDHYLVRRACSPGLRLAALYSTKPLGAEVAAFTAGQGGAPVPDQGAALDPDQAAGRIESAGADSAAAAVAQVPVHRRWEAAISLAKDALEAASSAYVVEAASMVAEPLGELRAALAELEAGRASEQRLEQIAQLGARCRALAQSKRIPDQRLEPIELDQPVGGWGEVSPPNEAFAYLAPFWAARVSDMLAVVLRSRVEDRYLTQEQLGELAYEHYFVRERISDTAEVLLAYAATAEADSWEEEEE